MSADDIMAHLPILLRPDPSRVVIRPFIPAEDPPAFAAGHAPRAQRIADRVLAPGKPEMQSELARVTASLTERHQDITRVLIRRFHEVNGQLIGAYFSEEYAFEAAALFNPSIVIHPDRSVVVEGACRFVLSLRSVGEGHMSSVRHQHSWDNLHDLNNGGFLAHRSRMENEDETEIRNTSAVVRSGCERHPQSDTKTVFG